MDKNSVLTAFCVPAIVVLHAILQFSFRSADGWSDIIFGIEIAVALLAAVLVGVALFLLRSRNVRWWLWLIISFASVPVGFGILMLLVRLADGFSGYR